MALITINVERTMRERDEPPARRRRRRRTVVLGAAAMLVGGLLAASGARAAGVVSIPPKVLLSNTALGAQKSVAVTVLGGSTTVPSDATRVVLSATVTNSTANGTVLAYPQGDEADASGDSLSYTSGQAATGSFTELVGTNDKVTFVNQGTTTIRLSVSVTGYSTEVHAGDISASGGSAGDVLTNTGTGAAWQPASHAYGVDNPDTIIGLRQPMGYTTVASVTVPAGSYVVTFTTTLLDNTRPTAPNVSGCDLFSPANTVFDRSIGNTDASNPYSVLTAQGLVATATGGTISAQCYDSSLTAQVYSPSLIATSVGAVSVSTGNAAAHQAAVTPAGPRAPTIKWRLPATH